MGLHLRVAVVAAMAAVAFAAPLPAMAGEAVELTVTIKDHKFEPDTLKVPAGKAILLRVDNQDASAEEFESDKLGVEKIIPGNTTGIVRIRALEPGSYEFVGEFHESTAKGMIVAE